MTISLDSITSDPTGTENGLVVRNIPSGTQNVSIETDGYAISVVELKDTGRIVKTFAAIAASVSAGNTETMVTLTPASDFTTGSTGTSFGVTAGKTLRIQALHVNFIGGSLTPKLRISNSGTVTTSTLEVLRFINSSTNIYQITFPDGLELSGNMQFGVSIISAQTFITADIFIIGYEY